MSTHVFIERSRLGKVIYEIKEDKVSVSGRRALRRFALEVPLRSFSGRTERLSRRFYRPMLRLFLWALLMLTILVLFCLQTRVPLGAVMFFMEIAAIWGGGDVPALGDPMDPSPRGCPVQGYPGADIVRRGEGAELRG
jgi:hypothetical protein